MTYRISKYHPLFSKHVDDWTAFTDIAMIPADSCKIFVALTIVTASDIL